MLSGKGYGSKLHTKTVLADKRYRYKFLTELCCQGKDTVINSIQNDAPRKRIRPEIPYKMVLAGKGYGHKFHTDWCSRGKDTAVNSIHGCAPMQRMWE